MKNEEMIVHFLINSHNLVKERLLTISPLSYLTNSFKIDVTRCVCSSLNGYNPDKSISKTLKTIYLLISNALENITRRLHG